MRNAIIAFVLFAFAGNAVAMADLYINPKGDIKLLRVSSGCHAWGASVRCDLDGIPSGWADFRLKDNENIGCNVFPIRKNGSKWDAWTNKYAYLMNDQHKIKCSQYWVNNNTLDITGLKQ